MYTRQSNHFEGAGQVAATYMPCHAGCCEDDHAVQAVSPLPRCPSRRLRPAASSLPLPSAALAASALLLLGVQGRRLRTHPQFDLVVSRSSFLGKRGENVWEKVSGKGVEEKVSAWTGRVVLEGEIGDSPTGARPVFTDFTASWEHQRLLWSVLSKLLCSSCARRPGERIILPVSIIFSDSCANSSFGKSDRSA